MTFVRIALAAVLVAWLCDGVAAGPPAVPEPMRKLGDLVGAWRADRVEFYDASGEVRRVSKAETCNRAYLGGLAIHHEGRLLDPDIRTEGWYFYDAGEDRLRMASVSSRGSYDEFVGGWRHGELTLAMKSSSSYPGRAFRLITSEIGPDRFVERLQVSADDGATWQVANRQVFHKVGNQTEGACESTYP